MPKPTAVTIGNFDGVHLAHARLVVTARRAVGDEGRVVVLSFDPHPNTILRPDAVPGRLSTMQQRTKWLRDVGADEIIPLQPTPEFLRQTAEQFIIFLVKQWAPSIIVEGADFRFGRGRAGSIETLRQFESEHSFQTIVVDDVETALADQSIVRIGSSVVRWLISLGRVSEAQNLLGRPYEIIAEVTPGDRRGRTIGIPTANLDSMPQMLPADGIYAGMAITADGTHYPAAISVGTKPTFGANPRVCEAHLIGYRGPVDDYGWKICLRFHRWLRGQLIYSNADELIQQIQRDLRKTAEALS